MSDWLSEIEEEIVAYSYDSPAWRRIRRMARVLREQSEIINIANAFLIANWDFKEGSSGIDLHHKLLASLLKLSPDAKDLQPKIEEL